MTAQLYAVQEESKLLLAAVISPRHAAVRFTLEVGVVLADVDDLHDLAARKGKVLRLPHPIA